MTVRGTVEDEVKGEPAADPDARDAIDEESSGDEWGTPQAKLNAAPAKRSTTPTPPAEALPAPDSQPSRAGSVYFDARGDDSRDEPAVRDAATPGREATEMAAALTPREAVEAPANKAAVPVAVEEPVVAAPEDPTAARELALREQRRRATAPPPLPPRPLEREFDQLGGEVERLALELARGLVAAKDDLARATHARIAALTAERDEARAEAAKQTAAGRRCAEDLDETRKQLVAKTTELASQNYAELEARRSANAAARARIQTKKALDAMHAAFVAERAERERLEKILGYGERAKTQELEEESAV